MDTTAENMDTSTFVDCDDSCGALQNPVTLADYERALEHWRYHSTLGGCSHGC